jgi:hypothetical protein
MLVRRNFLKAALALPVLFSCRDGMAFSSVGASSDPFTMPELPGYPVGNQAYGGRTPVDKTLVGGENTAVFLTFGDSLMSNTVSSLYSVTQAKNQNFNVYNGGLYSTVEPLLGCQINAAQYASGCFFSRVGDSLIAAGTYARVIHAPMAVGGSLIADYATGGAVNGRIAASYRRLVANGLPPTAVFIMLGANDRGTDAAVLSAAFATIISTVRALTSVNIFVARHSLFGLATSSFVQTAQASVLSSGNNVYTGGDMDSLTGSGNYWDNTHFNSTGAAAAAALAVTAIQAHP